MPGCENNSDESRGKLVDTDGEMWLSSLRNFVGLAGALLLVALLANAYLLWVTCRRRSPVLWETARLTLRYSSVVYLSQCLVLASTILSPWVLFHTGRDVTLTLRCTRLDVDKVAYFGFILAGSGVVVICRQVCMLHTFQNETTLTHQHGGRTTRLLRDVVVGGVVCVVASIFLKQFAPDIDLPVCFVFGAVTSRTIYLLIVPVAVSIILGVVVVARATGPEVDVEGHHVTQTTGDDLSDKATLSLETLDFKNGSDETTHPRWNRFVIVANVSVLTWFVLAAAMALAGVLLQPTSVGTVVVMVSLSALDSAWSAFAVYRYWT